MRIGIVPALNRSDGGIFQYSMTMLETLQEWSEFHGGDDYVIFAHSKYHPAAEAFRGSGWTLESLLPPKIEEAISRQAPADSGAGMTPPLPPDPERVRFQPELAQWFEEAGIELMLYPYPHRASFEAPRPYVMAIHDLQHRLQPEFPEVSADGEWERREYLFRNGSRYATLLLADSQTGKEDILRFYGEFGVTEDRVKVLPFLPACTRATNETLQELNRARQKYTLPERFFFYPAQYWPHKNHARIVQALGLMKKRFGEEAAIVFTGSSSGALRRRTYQDMMKLAKSLGVERQVLDLGYVTDEEVAALYLGAVGLVMPTFFGPTNIPVLEAWALECPVLSSDIRGIREQVGEAGILVDPRSEEALAEGLHLLWSDEALRAQLVARGTRRLGSYTREDYRQRLRGILEEARERCRTEGPRISLKR